MEFGVRSDLVNTGARKEDGDAIIGMLFYVVAEAPDGRRWQHEHCWVGHSHDQSHPEADALCARIVAGWAEGRRLGLEHWTEIDPRYGSEAYAGLDATGYFRAAERNVARDAGEAVPFAMEDFV